MFRNLPKVTKNLIIINFIVWLFCFVMHLRGDSTVMDLFALHFPTGQEGSNFRFWQPLTYMFLHDDSSIWHILFNMYTLMVFGSVLERVWGPGKFALFYIVCGLGAALCQMGVQWITFTIDLGKYSPASVYEYYNLISTVGASGAIYGLLLGYGMLFPDSRLTLVFPPVTLTAKWFVIIFGGIEVLLSFLGMTRLADGVAHVAHLGGMLFGLLLILRWRKRNKLYEYHD